jgi:hypothetical protein
MALLFIAAILLSFTPLIVALLHTTLGLTWRADFLLGRLDTVRTLLETELKSAPDRSRNLYYQVVELYNHVKGFCSPRKLLELKNFWGAFTEGNDSARFEPLTLFERFEEKLRYLVPATVLSTIYLIGLTIVLLRFVPIVSPEHAGPSAPKDAAQVSQSAGLAPAAVDSSNKPSTAEQAKDLSRPTSRRALARKRGGARGATKTAEKVVQPLAHAPVPASVPAEVATVVPKPFCSLSELSTSPAPLACMRYLFLKSLDDLPNKNPPKSARLVTFDCLIYAFLGSFVFNSGIMVRRIFVWDISGQMYWWAAYRAVLSVGLAAVLHFTTDKVDPHLYFLIATASVSILDSTARTLRAKLFQSETVPKQNELSLQLVQGIDYWKEQRLMEEGIESVQHLATADFVLLALHTRSPLFTIMDWVDQAVFIQRFPGKVDKMKDTGLPTSAVELRWAWEKFKQEKEERPKTGMAPVPGGYFEYLEQLENSTGAKEGVLLRAFEAWGIDNQVQLLTLFWRANLGTPRK